MVATNLTMPSRPRKKHPPCVNGCNRPGSRHNGLCWACHADLEIRAQFSPGTPRSRRPGKRQNFLGPAARPDFTLAIPGDEGKIEALTERIEGLREAFSEGDGPRSLDREGVLSPGTLQNLSFGSRLRLFRRDARLSMARLAELSGVERANISRYENGHVMPRSIGTYRRLAQALGIKTSELIGNLLDRP